jgi:hypothetical protein
MKLILPQNLICCSLNEDTIDRPFDTSYIRLVSATNLIIKKSSCCLCKMTETLDADFDNGLLEIYYYLYAGSTVMRADEVSGRQLVTAICNEGDGLTLCE